MLRVRTIALCVATVSPIVMTTPSVSATPARPVVTCSVSTTLREGALEADVTCLESTLRHLGYIGVAGPDQFFGPSTTTAVRSFQTANALTPDGIVGPRTTAALGLVPPPAGALPPGPTVPAKVVETRVIGTSVDGRPITAVRMGTPGGRVVLLIGSIHGDETKGTLITQQLRSRPTPAGVDLWLIDTINPDGVADGTRGNANGVDLNRNFETGWSYIPRSTTNRQYSGESAADQPETKAVEAFIRRIRPTIGIWYHQDANSISASGARTIIPTTYGRLVDLQRANVPCSQKCTGTAGTFANRSITGSTNFLVELPGSAAVTAAMIRRHVDAVLAIVTL